MDLIHSAKGRMYMEY